jgi:hypothetical protein
MQMRSHWTELVESAARVGISDDLKPDVDATGRKTIQNFNIALGNFCDGSLPSRSAAVATPQRGVYQRNKGRSSILLKRIASK